MIMADNCGGLISVDPADPTALRLEPAGALYPNQMNCELTLVGTNGQLPSFTILSVDVEECCDGMSVFDGSSDSAPLLLRVKNSAAVGVTLTATTDRLFLLFTSDSSGRMSGFTAVLGTNPSPGAPCTSDDQCPGSKCAGGHCCRSDVSPLCTACNQLGACSTCVPGMENVAGACLAVPGSFCAADQARAAGTTAPRRMSFSLPTISLDPFELFFSLSFPLCASLSACLSLSVFCVTPSSAVHLVSP